MSKTTNPAEARAFNAFESSNALEPRNLWLHKVSEYLLQMMIAENPLVASSPVLCAQVAGSITKLLFEK